MKRWPVMNAPPSSLIYAIGDVHGRADLLEAVLDFVSRDSARRDHEPKVVFLGRHRRSWAGQSASHGPGGDDASIGGRDPASSSATTMTGCLSSSMEPSPRQMARPGRARALLSYDPMADRRRIHALTISSNHHPEHARILREASIVEIDGAFAFVHAGIDPDATPRSAISTRPACGYESGSSITWGGCRT